MWRLGGGYVNDALWSYYEPMIVDGTHDVSKERKLKDIWHFTKGTCLHVMSTSHLVQFSFKAYINFFSFGSV